MYYIYNVTSLIDESIHEQWLEWIKPQMRKMLNTKCFTRAKVTQVLVKEEMGGVTYSVQYDCPSKAHLLEFYEKYADDFQRETFAKFADKVLTFATELKVVSILETTEDF